MSQITLLTGPERRRRWCEADKLMILTEAFAPGACVREVARRHDISTGLIYTWRRGRMRSSDPAFVEAVMTREAYPPAGASILVELARGGRISIASSAPPALAVAVLRALR